MRITVAETKSGAIVRIYENGVETRTITIEGRKAAVKSEIAAIKLQYGVA